MRSGRRRVGGREAGLDAAHDAFYRGDIAKKIVAFMKEQGGLLSAEDLAEYHSPVGPPERRRFGDLEVFTCGAWCQGPVLLQTLALLEGTDLAGLGHNSADYVHQLTEALKLAFADREAYYGDPAMVEVPLATLISAEYAAERRKLIRPDRAWPEMPPPGDLGRQAGRGFGDFPRPSGDPNPEPDTSYVCVADRWGNLFSATPSDGSYGSPVVPGTGLIPSNRGSQSRPDPRHPAGVAPGKRPRLTPNPALAIKGGDALHAVRHARRRRADPGDAAGPAEPFRLWPGRAVGDREPAFCELQLSVVVRALRLLPRPAGDRGAHPRGGHRRTRRAAATRSSAGPTGSGPRVRSARSMSTRSAASSKPAPTRAAPPTRWGGSRRRSRPAAPRRNSRGTGKDPGIFVRYRPSRSHVSLINQTVVTSS